MLSLEVRGRDDVWELVIRDYPAQGINPNYVKLCNISRETAEILVDNKLAGDLYGNLYESVQSDREE